jgi:hypothetical protein
MANSLRNPVIKKLVMDKYQRIKESDKSFIYVDMKKEKINDIRINDSINFSRIIIETENNTIYQLTPAEFLRKRIEVHKDGKVVTLRGL